MLLVCYSYNHVLVGFLVLMGLLQWDIHHASLLPTLIFLMGRKRATGVKEFNQQDVERIKQLKDLVKQVPRLLIPLNTDRIRNRFRTHNSSRIFYLRTIRKAMYKYSPSKPG